MWILGLKRLNPPDEAHKNIEAKERGLPDGPNTSLAPFSRNSL